MSSDGPPDHTANTCPACRTEAEPGRVEMDNNGAIVPCWICCREEWRMDKPGSDSTKRLKPFLSKALRAAAQAAAQDHAERRAIFKAIIAEEMAK